MAAKEGTIKNECYSIMQKAEERSRPVLTFSVEEILRERNVTNDNKDHHNGQTQNNITYNKTSEPNQQRNFQMIEMGQTVPSPQRSEYSWLQCTRYNPPRVQSK